MAGIRFVIIIFMISGAFHGPILHSQEISNSKEPAEHIHKLDELVVTARRPLAEVGLQRTVFDSLALKENVALSMADILTYNSSVFVKNYGRATLSTVSFRGTSPGHTQVTWNGMRINNPMLGMTDFSTIPAYFVDKASLLHGTSSVSDAGGGLGGLVKLATRPDMARGFSAQYVQGIGSFSTFDEFLRVGYGSGRWQSSTRLVYSSSPNDYKYINRDKKLNIYDEDHNIIGQYHPSERNRSGAFKDLHVLQEVYYRSGAGDRLGLNVWYINSNRELPMLTTDYGDERDFENRQREQTLRSVVSWDHDSPDWRLGIKGGYIHTDMAYDYRRELNAGHWVEMTRSRNKVNTLYGQADAEYRPGRRLSFAAGLSAHQHFVRSEDKNVVLQDGDRSIIGYDQARLELSASVSARWQATDRAALSVVLRQEMFGDRYAPLIPALFTDFLISPAGNIMLKASVSRNHRFPTLNDMYFLPGGNPELKSESGLSYDAGLSFDVNKSFYTLSGGATWFDSYIDDWIIWLPTTKGFFSPRNVKSVHSYGLELSSNLTLRPSGALTIDMSGSYSWTPSVNRGEKMSPADQSVGKQLPYVPCHSSSVVARITWKSWSFLYKWAFYSERYTMSSNAATYTGSLPKYYMSNIALEKSLRFKPIDVQLKFAVNNLFNEEYLSVLSRPMPGINFEFFIGLTPRF